MQKCPSLFNGIKSIIDRKRIPGQFFLTGSSSFSAQKDIQESLTGRIGLCELFPLTWAEASESQLDHERLTPLHNMTPRIGIEEISFRLSKGGMPVPMFVRDSKMRNQYWKNWISTSLGRDLSRIYGRGYDPDFAERILYELGDLHRQGIFPTLADFKEDARKVKKYIQAFRHIFMVRMLTRHEKGTGRDIYLFSDSGLAAALMRQEEGSETLKILLRIYLLNEIFANTHYAGLDKRWSYFKSRKGEPIDLVWDGVPIKFITSIHQTGWEERAIAGAMKALKSPVGLLVGPTDSVTLPTKKGIGMVPWSFWS